MPVTTNCIQDWRIRPRAWSHSPRICYRLPRSLACHHYATPMSYSTISRPHNPTQNTTRPRPNEHSRTRVTTVLAQARVPPTHLLEFLLKFLVASLYLVPFHLCILLFSPWLYYYPVPTLYLSLYLLCLVIWSLDSHISWYPSLSSIVSLLLYAARPLSWMHRLTSRSSYISFSYLLCIPQFEYQLWHLSSTSASRNLCLASPSSAKSVCMILP